MKVSDKVANLKTKGNFVAPVAGIGAGYQFNEFFRADVNAQYRNTPTKFKSSRSQIKNKSYAVMVNGSVDMPTSTMFTPYATAGLGFGKLKKATTLSSGKTKDKSGLVWNVGFGAKTQLQSNVGLDVGYKFVNLGEVKLPQGKLKVQAHELTAGVIVSF